MAIVLPPKSSSKPDTLQMGVSMSPNCIAMDWSFPRWIILVALSLMALLIILSRCHTYNEPLERDVTGYAVIGHELLRGREMYSDMWDRKPPLLHVTYAAAELIAGYGPQEIFLLNVVAAITTLVGLYAAGSYGGKPAKGLVAATMWVIAGGSLPLEANQPNTEVFINACLIWGVALLWRDRGRGWGMGRAIAVGTLFAAASLYKHVVVVVPLCLAIAYLIDPPGGRRTRAFLQLLVIGGLGIGAWAGLFAYFGLTHRATLVFNSLFVENKGYAGSLIDNLLSGLSSPKLFSFPQIRPLVAPSIAFGVVGFLSLLRIKPQAGSAEEQRLAAEGKHRLLWVFAWTAGTWMAFTLPGKFYAHYYQLWLPPILLGGGWAVVEAGNWLAQSAKSRIRRIPRWAIISIYVAPTALVLTPMMITEVPAYALPANEWAMQKYHYPFIASREMAERINKMLLPNEQFYNWGTENGLYFYSHRSPPVGLLEVEPALTTSPMINDFEARVSRQLSARPPELLVISAEVFGPLAAMSPIFSWLSQRYEVLPGQTRPRVFTLAYLRGGALEKRLGLTAHETTSPTVRSISNRETGASHTGT